MTEEFFGYQLYTDESDEYIAKEERLLNVASRLSFSEAVEGVRKLGGLVVPAHVDRPANSVIGQLGFIPPDEEIDLIEISRNRDVGKFLEKHPYLKPIPLSSVPTAIIWLISANAEAGKEAFP